MDFDKRDPELNGETTLNESYILVQAHENADPSV
jgi:hypothetical protein